MVSNVINIKKLMQENTNLRISSGAIKEIRSFLVADFERIMNSLEERARKNGRWTIMANDVIQYFAHPMNNISKED